MHSASYLRIISFASYVFPEPSISSLVASQSEFDLNYIDFVFIPSLSFQECVETRFLCL